MNDLFNTYESTRIYLALGTFSTILAGFTNIFLHLPTFKTPIF